MGRHPAKNGKLDLYHFYRAGAVATRLEVIATRVEAIARRVEAIATSLEAIPIR